MTKSSARRLFKQLTARHEQFPSAKGKRKLRRALSFESLETRQLLSADPIGAGFEMRSTGVLSQRVIICPLGHEHSVDELSYIQHFQVANDSITLESLGFRNFSERAEGANETSGKSPSSRELTQGDSLLGELDSLELDLPILTVLPAIDHPDAPGCCCGLCTASTQWNSTQAPAVDDTWVPMNGPPSAPSTPAPLSDTFLLHSLPGANHTIHLDFDGHVTSSTIWNTLYTGGNSFTTPAFNFEGTAGSFTDNELARIQWIWARVAEDFAPFNVNVTTQDPGAAALSRGTNDTQWGVRVVIGGSSGDWYGQSVGGIAYIGSFNWSNDTPVYVFPAQLGGGNEKNVANAISHEAGHALGLNHHGRTSPSEEYYAGHGSGETGWAPIMGNPYSRNVNHWSKGEYANANNSGQDDLLIITSQNGFTYRVDDHGGNQAGATALTASAGTLSAQGIIERNTDFDVFSFTTTAGTLDLWAVPAWRGASLDISLELLDSNFNVVATSSPAATLSASLSTSVNAGNYFIRITGTGTGNPLNTGYSDYGSIGQYFISATLPNPSFEPDYLAIVATDADKPEGNSGSTTYTFTVNRSGLDLNRTTTVNFAVTGQGANPASASDFVGGVFPSGTLTFTSGQTSQTVQIQVAGDTTVESDEGFLVTLSNPSALAVINTASATGIIRNDDFHPDFLEIVATDADKPEGNSGSTTYTFTVNRSGLDLNRTTTVNFAVTGQGVNPASASDFVGGVFPSGTITFTSGQTSQTVQIQVSGDTTVESDEGFQVTLSNPSALAIINTASANGVIRNDDFHPDFLEIVATDADKPEGNSGSTTYTFTVNRSGLDLNRTTTVNFAVTGQGANPASASDFVGGVFPSGTLTFTSGQTSQTVQIQVAGDTTVESDEGFQVTLSNPSALAVINTASATGVIRNDDFHPDFLEIVATDADKPEGNSGSTTYTFSVNRSGLDLNRTTTVNYAVTGQGVNPASASDFVGGVFPSGTITFTSGQTSQTVQIQVAGDTTVESDEGFQVTLSNPSALAIINTASANGVIRNDDFHPDFLEIVATDADKPEGNSGSTTYTFTVNRSGLDLNRTTTVNFAVTGQGANPASASDFVGGVFPSGTITFTSGQTSQTVQIQVAGDTTVESDEGFQVTLSNPSALAVINTAAATGVIRNDDFHPDFLEIVATDADKPEGNSGSTTYTFTVNRSGLDLNRTTTVNYAVTGQGANPASASDFVGGVFPSGSITFTSGQTSQTVQIQVAGDTTVESDEGFLVTLSNPSALAVINTTSASGIIRNDDFHPDFLEIVATDADKPEGNSGSTTYNFTVNRSGLDLNRTTTVNYAVTGQGANPASASDFVGGVFPSGTITFTSGQTSQTVQIQVAGDTTVESDEGFQVTLSNPSALAVINTASATGVIRNDDFHPDFLEIVATDADKPEGNSGSTTYTFTVNRSGLDLNRTTTVNYAVTGQGANPASASDFVGGVFPSGTITFTSGQTSQTVQIQVAGDTTVESDEGFQVTLSNPSALAVINTASANGVIRNDDFHPDFLEIVATDADKPEGNSGSTIYTFTVNRSGLDLNRTTTVNYAVTGQGGNPASASDFVGGVFPSGTITFTSGQTSQTVQIQVAGDTTVESDEGFLVTLSNPSALAVINTATASGVIRNDDFHPDFLEIVATDADKPEGNSGSTTYTFTVNRSGLDLNRTTTVNFAVTGQGANPASASDFVGGVFTSGTITFTSGQTSQTVQIQVAGDTTVESDEGFQVTLSNPSALAVINTASANGIIRNDDFHPDFLEIVATDADKPEGNSGSTTYTFTVNRSGLDLNRTTTVNYTVTGQGANPASASDFVGGVFPSGTITFTSGQTSQTVQIQVSGDTTVESDEGFQVTLSNPSALAVINTASANGIIRNDDFHPDFLEIVATDADKPEGNSGSTTYTFTVNRSGLDLNRTTTVNYAVTGQGANPASASDFVGGVFPSGTITFTSGQTSQTVQIQVSGDTTVESDEGFQVTLSNPSALAVINTATASGIIRNDDFHPDFLEIVATDADKPEGNSGSTIYTFTVNRSGLDLNRTTTVNYAVTGQGANPASASDFVGGVFPSGTITFTSGQTSQTVQIQVAGDATVESDEGFQVTLSNPSALAVINTASATGVIRNDDFHPDFLEIVATDADKPEGNSGSTTYTFTVNRSGLDLNRTTTVNYAVTGQGANPASASDFTGGVFPSGTITFTSGQTSQIVQIQVAGDTTVESDEGFLVTLSNPSALAVINTASASGIIRNDDFFTDTLTLTAVDADKLEGSSGATPFLFVVTRSGSDLSATTTVDFTVTGHGPNPANADDFVGGVFPSGGITFNPGQTSYDLIIEVSGDLDVELDESFLVTLSNPSLLTVINTGSAVGIIRTDDHHPDFLEIVATDADRPEGNSGSTIYTFTVNRSGLDLNRTTTVNYSVTGQGANPAEAGDFTGGVFPSGTITFTSGQTSQTVQIQVSGDTTVESDEGFQVTLSNPSALAVINTASASGIIRNDDFHPDFLEITATDADKPEGNSGTTAFTFTVIRSGLDLNRTTTVNYTVLGQGANPASGSDFATSVFPSGTITFTSGQTSQTLEIQIAGDTTVEPDEGFQVVLSNPSALAVINTATASGVIRNDDFHPDFLAITATDADKPEGDSGATAYTFTISRIGLDLNRTTTVNYAVTGQGANPASASDFVGGVFPSGTITFTSGQTSQTVQIQVSGDTAVESDEGFEVTLSDPSALAVINTASATGIIRNDDFHPDFLEIVATDADKPEGNSGSTTYTFTVNRSGLDLDRTTTVNYAVTGQGANPASASDFVGGVFPSGTITLTSGQTSQTVQIQVAGDTTVESDEGFQVTLSNPSALAVINTAAATGVIRNDDFHPDFLGIVATDADKPEGNSGPTSYTFTINRNGSDLNRTTTVNYTVTGQGANPADASDFVGGIFPTGTITFTSGQTSQTLQIQVSGDTTVEFDEGFLITLSDPSPLAVINTASASGVIRNDDFHPDFLEIVATDADKPEGNSGPTTFTFTIQRTGLDLNRVTTVSYSVNGLGADPASTSDFVGGNYPSGIVTFAVGQASHTLEILVSGDTTVEADEGFEVTLSSPSALAVINTASAAGIIRNDDSHPDFLEIVATDADQPEGNSGTTIYTFTINRSGIDLNRTTTVNYAVTGQGANPASAGDFAGGVWPSGTVTFAPGQTSETIEIEVVGDTLVEFDERFVVTLSNPSAFTVLAVASASGTIRDDDTPNEPDRLEIVATDAVKPEGLFGPTPFTFTINRSGSSLNHTTTVDYSVSGFGANPASPNDFVGNAYPSGTIQFLPGQTSFSLVIMVNGDMQPEPDEGFRVTLSNASLTTVIDTAVATGLIQRDELESGNNGNSGSSASTVERLSTTAISLVRLGTSLPTAPLPTEPTDRIWFKPPKRFSKSWWRRKLKFW